MRIAGALPQMHANTLPRFRAHKRSAAPVRQLARVGGLRMNRCGPPAASPREVVHNDAVPRRQLARQARDVQERQHGAGDALSLRTLTNRSSSSDRGMLPGSRSSWWAASSGDSLPIGEVGGCSAVGGAERRADPAGASVARCARAPVLVWLWGVANM